MPNSQDCRGTGATVTGAFTCSQVRRGLPGTSPGAFSGRNPSFALRKGTREYSVVLSSSKPEAGTRVLAVEAETELEARRRSGSQCSTSETPSADEVVAALSQALRETPGRLYCEPCCVSNALESPKFRKEPSAQKPSEQTEAVEETQGRRKRGRPPGLQPWNKGRRMPLATRAKISTAQKARWRDPSLGLQAVQRERQKGRIPWNKGKTMSLETRLKMSEAKRHAVYARATTSKMSRSHKGMTHSPETCALLSQKLSGKAKTPEHRAAIAAGQRKRIAAARLLGAIHAHLPRPCSAIAEPLMEVGSGADGGSPEEVEIEALEGVLEGPEMAAALPGGGDMFVGAGREAKARKKPPPRSSAPNLAVVEEFVGQLREFRALQQELAPWTEAFKLEHGRKPRVDDVELTRIEWLINKYKEYVSMRDRLLNQSQQLRSKLESGGIPSIGTSSYAERMNANDAGASVAEGATRIAKAIQYKRSLEAVKPLGSRSSTPSAPAQGSASDKLRSNGASSAQNGGRLEKQTSASADPQQEQQSAKKTPPPDSIGAAMNMAGAPSRVRVAMLAAAKYRKDKGKAGGSGAV